MSSTLTSGRAFAAMSRLTLSSTIALILASCASAPVATPAAPTAPTAATPAAPAPAAARSTWALVSLGDIPCGRSREVTTPSSDGGAETHVTFSFKITQLGAPLSVEADEVVTEDREGAIRSVHMERQASGVHSVIDVTVSGAAATVKEKTGASETVRTVPVSSALLGPAEIKRRSATKLHAAGDKLDFVSWSTELSAPAPSHMTVEAVDTVKVDGVDMHALRVKQSTEGESSPSVAWLDESGQPLKEEVALPFGTLRMTRTASEPTANGDPAKVDAIEQTIIRSNVRILDPRSLDRLTVRITPKDPSRPLPSLEGPGQKVLSRDERGVVLAIERVAAPSPHAQVDPQADDQALLGASGVVDPTDAGVRAVVLEVTAGLTDPWTKAQKLTGWVAAHMTYDPKVAGAPAGVVVKDLHGTCDAYATLLTSLLRAAQIPARKAAGVLYAGGMFGGHAWSEARIDGRWIPVDAAAGDLGTADAAHIAFSHDTSAPGGSVAQIQVLGHVKLAVLEYTPHGRPGVVVDADQAPYVVEGMTYRNPGLGFSMTLPKGGTYSSVDGVWPNPNVVAAEASGQKVFVQEIDLPQAIPSKELEAKILGLSSLDACEHKVVGGQKACGVHLPSVDLLSFHRGSSMLVFLVAGDEARGTLGEIAKTVRFGQK